MKYKRVTVHNHPFFPSKIKVLEHRLVMAEYLGRPLLRSEDVHHKNENTLDNQIGNLEIKLHGEHTIYHHTGSHCTVETKHRISLAKMGHPPTLGFTGRHHTIRSNHKNSLANMGENNAMFGKRHSIESKRRM